MILHSHSYSVPGILNPFRPNRCLAFAFKNVSPFQKPGVLGRNWVYADDTFKMEKDKKMFRVRHFPFYSIRKIGILIIILLFGVSCSHTPKENEEFVVHIRTQEDLKKLDKVETILTVTPEKAALHPDYQIMEEIAVPYLPEYRIGPGDVVEIVYHIRYKKPLENYRLEVQDRISIHFPYHPQFNSTVLVRTDGKITVPLLGDVMAEGKSPEELSEILNRRYGQYLNNPTITVSLEEFNVKILELKRAITTAPRGQSKIAPVTPDGRISFPIIGNVYAAGFTISQLEKLVNDLYSKQFRNLHATLILLEIHQPKFYIVGEVNRPGSYDMTYRTTLLECLALANGHKKSANLREVMILRNEGLEKPVAFKVDLESALSMGNAYPNLRIKPADIIYVPKTGLDSFNDLMEKIFTKGLYAMIPFTTTFSWNAPQGRWFPP